MRIFARKLLRVAISIVVIVPILAFHRPTLAAVSCPAKSRAMPVISWLLDHVDSVTVHHFSKNNVEAAGYPKATTNSTFINGLLKLTGSYVKWNGYDAPSPFGYFFYPRWGNWYAQYELHTGKTVRYLWLWHSNQYNTGWLLAFAFSDMTQSADSAGQHLGQHDFCVTAVPLSAIKQLERSIK